MMLEENDRVVAYENTVRMEGTVSNGIDGVDIDLGQVSMAAMKLEMDGIPKRRGVQLSGPSLNKAN